jgi:ribosomal protein L32
MADDPKRNPGWNRPPDWKYEEDWNSPAWKERMRQVRERLAADTAAHGFEVCPKCGQAHNGKTLRCRACNYYQLTPSRFATWLWESDRELGAVRFEAETEVERASKYLEYAEHCMANVPQVEWPGCILKRLRAET